MVLGTRSAAKFEQVPSTRNHGILPADYCGKCGAWFARQPGQTGQIGSGHSEQVDDDGETRRDEFERGS